MNCSVDIMIEKLAFVMRTNLSIINWHKIVWYLKGLCHAAIDFLQFIALLVNLGSKKIIFVKFCVFAIIKNYWKSFFLTVWMQRNQRENFTYVFELNLQVQWVHLKFNCLQNWKSIFEALISNLFYPLENKIFTLNVIHRKL